VNKSVRQKTYFPIKISWPNVKGQPRGRLLAASAGATGWASLRRKNFSLYKPTPNTDTAKKRKVMATAKRVTLGDGQSSGKNPSECVTNGSTKGALREK
jgi:hypothetical protein